MCEEKKHRRTAVALGSDDLAHIVGPVGVEAGRGLVKELVGVVLGVY